MNPRITKSDLSLPGTAQAAAGEEISLPPSRVWAIDRNWVGTARANSRNLGAALSAGILVGVDLLSYYVSALLGFVTRHGMAGAIKGVAPLSFSLGYLLSQFWIPLVFIGFLAFEGLYFKRLPFWDEPKEILKALFMGMVTIFAIVTLGKMHLVLSRAVIVLTSMYGVVLFFLFRWIAKRSLFALGIWRENVLILGAGKTGTEIAVGLSKDRHQGYRIAGFLDDDEGKVGKWIAAGDSAYKVFAKTRQLLEYADLLSVNTVVVAMPSMPSERLSRKVNEIQKHFRTVLLVPDIKGTSLLNTELCHLFTQQLYLFHINNSLKTPHNRLLKSSFDFLLSILLFPVLLVMMGAIGMAIRLDSPGPIFFSHFRVGRNGNRFRIWKFRTMYQDAEDRLDRLMAENPEAREEWIQFFKLRNDPRVTRVGRFLRMTSLDELPQILNVFLGDMSLIGPRPVLREELERYYKEYADYYFMVRPGITGFWQVSGRSDTSYEQRVWLDTWYVLNWTLWLDIVILLKTVGAVFRREGAY